MPSAAMMASLVAALCAVSLSHPAARTEVVWEPVGLAQGNTTVTIQIAQPKSVADELHRVVVAVSTPGSPDYGRHLSFDELNDLVRVPDSVTRAARAWCDDRGFACDFVGTGDLLRVTAPAEALSAELGARLETFTHELSSETIVRSRDAVEPSASMRPWADCFMGLSTFPRLTAPMVTAGGPQGEAITPALLKGPVLYNITDVASPDSKSSMAVAEFQGQGYLPTDLEKFESKFNLPLQKVRNMTGSPDGDKSAGVEAELDIQYIIATGTGVPADFYLHPGNAFDLAGWAASVLADPKSALVWSVSYGEGVNGGIGGVIPVKYVTALNFQLEKFAARGMSVLIASGDSGVYDRKPFDKTKFHPSFPACLPAATAVGSTQLDGGVEDSGVSFSGGGFTPSNYFTRAANATWQSSAVSAYLSSDVKFPPQDLWDRNGRGIPDVSAVGVDYEVVVSGMTQGVSGTSASTPAVAGIIALINDKLMAKGQPPLGFLNPFLYAHPEGFRDILKGYNDGGGGGIFKKGFYAAKGWDPVTGMGTPNYPSLLAAALAAAGL